MKEKISNYNENKEDVKRYIVRDKANRMKRRAMGKEREDCTCSCGYGKTGGCGGNGDWMWGGVIPIKTNPTLRAKPLENKNKGLAAEEIQAMRDRIRERIEEMEKQFTVKDLVKVVKNLPPPYSTRRMAREDIRLVIDIGEDVMMEIE